ncbi:zinc finger protein ZAT5-like [Chenopodium quinoa]|uniref:zinc finger protein ZAT5-like n=1 Tax=Chenopodium quinoa TaxID=63459 RepID=UPI000B778316|nr:zinc finger protein ZAT5-like [Chenopodium quinoa]
MESTEEEFSSFTTKGRRTKRQRSLLAATASSSYRGGGGGDGGAVVVLAATRGGDNCSDNNSYGSSSSGASPSDEHDIMSEVTTTEEEDMANCLILLAQGIERKVSHIIKSKTKTNNNNNITSTTTSTSNISTYECKTCNKTFPSFQALGGHRTSHKKIKPSTPTVVVPPTRSPDTNDTVLHDRDRSLMVDDDLDVAEFTSKKYFLVQSNNDASKARVHECSICGSEFPSGQALGGHMRRHRAAAATTTTTTTTTTTMTTSPISTTATAAAAATTTTVIDTGGPRNILSLDLNLPAPDDQEEQQHIEVADHMDTKFVHVLPTPTPLVDCHY